MQFEDIHLSDTQNYNLFKQYYAQGNYTAALNLLRQNPSLDTKATIAENLNDLGERLYGFENEYYTEVEDYLSNLYDRLGTDVNNLSNQNQYSATQQYYPKNFVYYNDDVYFCISQPPIGTLPTNTTYWLHLGLLGNQGEGALSNLTFKGQWSGTAQYSANDVVYVGYTFYYALQSNVGQQPSSGGDSNWGVLFVAQVQQAEVAVSQPSGLNTGDLWFQILTN